ncbi:hypothetical protein B0H14DRAFT_2640220 [Mycena olivaceomarginata]|nr:hypothetical protein B0H14DRAFT_2640220 [Mycena olivaceomarginata]
MSRSVILGSASHTVVSLCLLVMNMAGVVRGWCLAAFDPTRNCATVCEDKSLFQVNVGQSLDHLDYSDILDSRKWWFLRLEHLVHAKGYSEGFCFYWLVVGPAYPDPMVISDSESEAEQELETAVAIIEQSASASFTSSSTSGSVLTPSPSASYASAFSYRAIRAAAAGGIRGMGPNFKPGSTVDRSVSETPPLFSCLPSFTVSTSAFFCNRPLSTTFDAREENSRLSLDWVLKTGKCWAMVSDNGWRGHGRTRRVVKMSQDTLNWRSRICASNEETSASCMGGGVLVLKPQGEEEGGDGDGEYPPWPRSIVSYVRPSGEEGQQGGKAMTIDIAFGSDTPILVIVFLVLQGYVAPLDPRDIEFCCPRPNFEGGKLKETERVHTAQPHTEGWRKRTGKQNHKNVVVAAASGPSTRRRRVVTAAEANGARGRLGGRITVNNYKSTTTDFEVDVGTVVGSQIVDLTMPSQGSSNVQTSAIYSKGTQMNHTYSIGHFPGKMDFPPHHVITVNSAIDADPRRTEDHQEKDSQSWRAPRKSGVKGSRDVPAFFQRGSRVSFLPNIPNNATKRSF